MSKKQQQRATRKERKSLCALRPGAKQLRKLKRHRHEEQQPKITKETNNNSNKKKLVTTASNAS
jgi:hypothetical protein